MMIRIIEKKDINQVLNIYIPYVLNTTVSFEIKPPTYHVFKKRVKEILKYYPFIVYVEGDVVLGYAYASRFRSREAYDRSVEISIYVSQQYRNKGIGSKLMADLINRLYSQGVSVCVSCISASNSESDIFHQRMGFNLDGIIKSCAYKHDSLLDLKIYSKVINDNIVSLVPYKMVK